VLGDLLTPWFLLALILVPIYLAERWIQSHLYGVGWLLTNDQESATILYYFFLFPGVFLHEFIQWLLGYAIAVTLKPVRAWPQAQENGTLRYDFVQIEKANWLQSAILGAVPLIAGTTIVWFISNQILNLEELLSALGTGDITVIGPAIKHLGSTPDFYLWLYLMFTISNTMLPTPADRRGWPLLFASFGIGIVFLILIGLGDQIYDTFTGPVAHGIDLLITALGTVLVVEFTAILLIGFMEEVLEKLTKRKFQYSPPKPEPAPREPGSAYLPPGVPRPSIYNLPLPVPDPAEHGTLLAKARRATKPDAEAEKPAAFSRPSTPGSRPAFGTSRPAFSADDDEKDDKPSSFQRPGSRPAFGTSRPALSATDDDEKDDKPSPFQRPGSRPAFGTSRPAFAADDDDETDDEDDDDDIKYVDLDE